MFVVFYSISPQVIFCLLINLHYVYGPYTDRKVPLRSVQTVRIVKPFTRRSGNEIQLSDCIRFTDLIGTEKCLYDLYKSYGSSKRSPVAQVMRCNCQTVYGPKIVFTIRTDREAVFSDRISLSNRTDRKAVFSDRISLSILDMSGNFLKAPLPPNNVEHNWNHSDRR